MASTLTHNPEKVRQCLRELPTGELICTQHCRIQIPTRYRDAGMAEIGIDTSIYGIFALILDDGSYSVTNILAMVKIRPYKILTVNIDGVAYYEFYFQPNKPVLETIMVVKDAALIYNVLNDFIFHGKMPWFVNYDRSGELLDFADHYAGSGVANNQEAVEFIVSIIARDPKNKLTMYRTTIKTREAALKSKPVIVPLMSVFYSASNTVSKIAGNYFSDGVVSALVNPAQSVEKLESLLRA